MLAYKLTGSICLYGCVVISHDGLRSLTLFSVSTRKMSLPQNVKTVTGSRRSTSSMLSRCRRGLCPTVAGGGEWRRAGGERRRPVTGQTGTSRWELPT